MIKAANISKSFGKKKVIDNIDLNVEKGEIVSILGPNGAGKSTAMKAMLGLLKLKSGKVVIDGKDISNLNPQDRVKLGIAFVPQNRNVFAGLTVRENLEMGAFLRNESIKEILDRIYDLFPILKEKKSQLVGELSGGQRQRAVIARTLASEAEFILLDEPLVGVDRESRNSLLKFLDNLCHRYQKTILMVSHDITAIKQTSHRMIFLEEKIGFDGSASSFPGLAELANIRGLQPVHNDDVSENKIYQLEEMGDK